jgi:Flp pilus assembly pilin Flp
MAELQLLVVQVPAFDKHLGLGHYGCVVCGFFLYREWMDWRESMSKFIRRIWWEEDGQDIAEYAVMLAVILVLVVGTIRLIGSNANNAFSNVASSIQ